MKSLIKEVKIVKHKYYNNKTKFEILIIIRKKN